MKAVAVSQESILGEWPRVEPETVEALADARRAGVATVLVSSRSLAELTPADGGRLLSRFDAVVAEAGAVVETRAGVHRTLHGTPSTRTGLLRALSHLEISARDTLALSADRRDLGMLDAAEVAVSLRGAPNGMADRADLTFAGSPGTVLAAVMDGVLAGRPRISPPRHDLQIGWRSPQGTEAGCRVPGAHSNLVVRAAVPGGDRLPGRVVVAWVRSGYRCLVIDLCGRLQTWVPVTHVCGGQHADVVRPWDVERVVNGVAGSGPMGVVDLSSVAPRDRHRTMVAVLAAVQALRARTGRPHVVVVDDAEVLLRDPDVPPEVLRLCDPGHLLVLRGSDPPPPELLRVTDAVLPSMLRLPLTVTLDAVPQHRERVPV